MGPESTSGAGPRKAHVPESRGKAYAAALFRAALIALVVVAHFSLADPSLRFDALRAILLFAAAGEAVGGCFGVFRPRWLAERNGRPYDPAYHGVSQDFGFYNLAFALLLSLAAVEPTRSTIVIAVAMASYAVHGVTHVFRYFGLYYGGGAPIPTRPQLIELQQGLELLAAAIGMALFFA